MACYLIEERRRWPVIPAYPRGQCSKINKFRILKETHVQMRKPYQSPGRMKNSSYYNVPVGDWTHDLPQTVASHMVKLSHALNHSATEAVEWWFTMMQSVLCIYGSTNEGIVTYGSFPSSITNRANMDLVLIFGPYNTASSVVVAVGVDVAIFQLR